MKSHPNEFSLISLLLLISMFIISIVEDRLFIRSPEPAQTSTSSLGLVSPEPTVPSTLTPGSTPTPTETLLPPTDILSAGYTATLELTDTIPAGKISLDATKTPTFREMLKDHIVFYLIQPEKGRQDACGDIRVVPIVSKRLRSGDKLYDVQVALNMLFNLKSKIYIQWYNALWDTDLSIDHYDYIAQKDYMIINFAGYLPAGRLSNCDKHGIRQQIWTTFFHYGIKEKTFKINGVFLIDQLNRKTK